MISPDMMASLSMEDIVESPVLLSMLGGLMGGTLVLFLLSNYFNHFNRYRMLLGLVEFPGRRDSFWFMEIDGAHEVIDRSIITFHFRC